MLRHLQAHKDLLGSYRLEFQTSFSGNSKFLLISSYPFDLPGIPLPEARLIDCAVSDT